MAEINVRINQYYNQKPRDIIYYVTLELFHPSFVDPLRFVHDYTEKTFTLESSAPRDAGLPVVFSPLNFSAPPPDQDDTTSVNIKIDLGRVGSEVKEQLKKIQGFGFYTPVDVIYRRFLSDDTSAPVKVYKLFANQPTIKANNVSFTASDDNPSKQNVARLYQFDAFPGLESV